MSERMESVPLELLGRFTLELPHNLPDVMVATSDHGVDVLGQYGASAETIPRSSYRIAESLRHRYRLPAGELHRRIAKRPLRRPSLAAVVFISGVRASQVSFRRGPVAKDLPTADIVRP